MSNHNTNHESSMAIIYFSLNKLVSIIIEAFDIVRAEAKGNPNEFYFYTHVSHKWNGLFRKASSDSFTKPSEYIENSKILPRRINALVNFIFKVIDIIVFKRFPCKKIPKTFFYTPHKNVFL